MAEREGYPRIIPVAELYAQPEPPPEAVWEVCPYLCVGGLCRHCPRFEIQDGEEVQRGCYTHAVEVCRIVQAALKRFPPPL